MNQLHILYLAALLMDMSVAGVTFAISRRAAELGATSSELGWLGAVWIGVYALLALATGRISDRVGRRRLAIIGCCVAAAMTVACSLTTRVPLLLVFSGGLGAAIACFWPSIITWLGEGLSGPALARRLTTFGVAWNAGLLLGYALTGMIFKHAPQLAFYVSAGIILLVALLLIVGRDGTLMRGPNGHARCPTKLIRTSPPAVGFARRRGWRFSQRTSP